MMQNSSDKNARQVALILLGAVMDKGMALDDACHGNGHFGRLSQRDQAFAKLLVLTVCRRLGSLNGLIDRLLEEPPTGDKGQVRRILQLGLAQLLYLGTPAHAAVGQTVELAARKPLFRFKGLVNAILRRVDREGEALMEGLEDPSVNARPWMLKAWGKTYGEDVAASIAEAHLTEAPLDLVVKQDPQDWAKKRAAEEMPGGGLRLPFGQAVPGLEGYKDGTWWVQDLAASLPVRLLGDLSGKTVVDLCAAPGGKTMQLAAAGAKVTAVDRHVGRLKRLSANLERTGLQAEIVEADALTWRPEAPVDLVVLDAPCSATGTIRRHPELQWIRTPKDIEALSEIQQQMLVAATEMLKPGGEILYITCSLQPQEGEEQIAGFLENHTDFSAQPFEVKDLAGLEQAVTAQGYLRTLPSYLAESGGMDGFFAARLTKAG